MSSFSRSNLPPFVENSAGVAHPKPDVTVAFVRTPASATLDTPWGQKLDVTEGVAHIALDAVGDNYPNLEFDTFYVPGEVLDRSDLRAAFLLDFWEERGFSGLEVREATKTRSATVLGVVSAEGAGAEFLNHEGTAILEEGSVILQSPDDLDAIWAIQPAKYENKYQPIER